MWFPLHGNVCISCLHGLLNCVLSCSKYQERDSLLSVVVDFRNSALTTARFVAETLLLLEVNSWNILRVVSVCLIARNQTLNTVILRCGIKEVHNVHTLTLHHLNPSVNFKTLIY